MVKQAAERDSDLEIPKCGESISDSEGARASRWRERRMESGGERLADANSNKPLLGSNPQILRS